MFDDKEFDSHFKNVQRFALLGVFMSLAISISVLGFVGWVIVKLLYYFGVI